MRTKGYFKSQCLIKSLNGTEYTDVQKKEMWIDIHYRSKCPECGAIDSFLQGPRGGLAVNIKCKYCHIVFWTTPFFGFGAYPINIDNPSHGGRRLLDDQNTHTNGV